MTEGESENEEEEDKNEDEIECSPEPMDNSRIPTYVLLLLFAIYTVPRGVVKQVCLTIQCNLNFLHDKLSLTLYHHTVITW